MTIVCGTDFSTPAGEALRVAALLAATLGEPLELVHVIEDVGAELTLRTQPDLLNPVRTRLRSVARRARELGAIVDDELVAGSAPQVLAARGARADVRLIVLSSAGQRAPARWLLGSVSERVARTSPAPVLVIRDAIPFERWLRGTEPLEVMVGAERSASSDAPLRWLSELRRIRPCNVTVTYVASSLVEQDRLGVRAATQDLEKLHPDIERTITGELAARVEELPGEGALRFLVRRGLDHVDRQLVAAAEETRTDLLVVGSHRRSKFDRLWHRSVSRRVLHLAPMSVARIPARVEESGRRRAPAFHRVLVATDFSEAGDRAVSFAISLLPNGGTLHLVHVLTPAVSQTPITELLPQRRSPSERTTIIEQAHDRLVRLVPEVIPSGLDVVVDVLEGSAAEELCRAAERLGVDAISIGSCGRSALSALLLGSVARGVIAKSRRPVLVVPPQR